MFLNWEYKFVANAHRQVMFNPPFIRFTMLTIFRNHVDVYRKRCKAFGVEPHPRVLFRLSTESSIER